MKQKNRIRGFVLVLASLCFAAFSTPLVSSAEVGSSYVICKLGKEVRTLSIQIEAGKCTTIYNKAGKSQDIGGGLNPQTCEEILGNVRKNLEEGNWKCRDVKEATVSNLGGGVE